MARYGDNPRQARPEIWSRDWIIVILFAAFLAAIIGQLVYIQVIRGPEYAQLAAKAHTANITLEARRGTVYDRNGEAIASNVDATTIYVNPQEVDDPAKLAHVLEETLGAAAGKTYEDYYSTVTQSDLSFAYIQRKADPAVAKDLRAKLEDQEVKGIHYLEDTKRVYPNGEVGSQVIGTVDVDGKGIAGLELQYNALLKGTDGTLIIEKGLNDIPIADGENLREEATDGIDIVTSLDIKLQERCEDALLAAITEHEARGGSATVLDAATGEIYASCSFVKKSDEELEAEVEAAHKKAANEKAINDKANGKQEGDASKKAESDAGKKSEGEGGDIDPDNPDAVGEGEVSEGTEGEAEDIEDILEVAAIPLYKLEVGKLAAITDVYEPGSTFKPFTAVSVLSNNPSINPESTYTVPYALDVYDSVITDSHDHETEDMSLTRILAESSNTGITLVSRAVERSDLYDTYNAFSLGKRTGVDFPGDASGQLEKSEDWDGVQGATVTFGQGLTITGLQLLRAYGALEQGGTSRIPHFLIDVPNDPAKASELIDPYANSAQAVADTGVCREVNEMLTHVVTEGTGEAAGVAGFAVTGKTGTAEVASASGGYEENAYIMSFCGWLYGSSSDLICLVTVDRPLWGQGGGDVCGPVFANIMSFAAERYQIDAQAR